MKNDLTKVKKYIGSCCGNSFIILDCRNFEINKQLKIDFSLKNIKKYKVDSALFLNKIKGFETYLEIFEKDGSESESCGNGIILISNFLGIQKGKIKLKNTDVSVAGNIKKKSQFLLMDIKFLHSEEIENNCMFIKVGEPHIVCLVNNLKKFDLIKIGKKIQKNYPAGVNVNVIQKINEFHYLIRTYERGVLAETKSCGTGSLASYIAVSHLNDRIYRKRIEFKSGGGIHWVSRVDGKIKLEILKKYCKISGL